MKKTDLIYRNTGKAMATQTQRIAFNISRSNAKDTGPWNVPRLMSEEGSALAKNSQPRNAFEVPYLDDSRERFAVSDNERESWRKFKPGDDPASVVSDPLTALVAESEEEPEEFDDEEPAEEAAAENEELARTQGAFDRKRLFRAIDRLVRRTKKRLKGRDDGRSYGRDDGRNYATAHGCLGGVTEWNALFRAGEIS